jgi:hypothetical protein
MPRGVKIIIKINPHITGLVMILSNNPNCIHSLLARLKLLSDIEVITNIATANISDIKAKKCLLFIRRAIKIVVKINEKV